MAVPPAPHAERVVYRFTRDLRLADHAGLAAAYAQGEVVPLFVLDPAMAQRMGRSPRRAAFLCSALAGLASEVERHGARLIVRRGAAGATLRQVARAAGARGVVWSCGYDRSERLSDDRVRGDLEEAGLRATLVHDAPVVSPDDLVTAREDRSEGFRAFAPFFEAWQRLLPTGRDPLSAGRLIDVGLQSEALPQPSEFGSAEAPPAGRATAHTRLIAFLDAAAPAYGIASRVPSENGTSRLSADLSFGTIAARTAVRETLRRIDDPFMLAEERSSLRAFLRSLALRDFFLHVAWHHPRTHDEPLQEKMREFAWARTHPALDAWRAGRTGFPLVDAGIRQLHATGWMHPRVRAVAASFLCFDLGVDWRLGRDEWDRYLTEDDPAIATGNWQWIAGIGADMAQFPRIYNPQRQRARIDPGGAYVRRYVSELAHVPVGTWDDRSASRQPQLALPLFGDAAYPRPVVDHEAAARAFIARYRAFSSSADARRASR